MHHNKTNCKRCCSPEPKCFSSELRCFSSGPRGVPGTPGSKIFVKSRNPLAAEGKECDLFINNLTDDYFQKIKGSWIFKGNLKGHQGPQGPQGKQGGTQGNQGNVGSQGNQGNVGSQGNQGERGPQGNQGNAGSQGNQGNIGSQGNQGERGPQGNVGSQGNQGERGPQGDVGSQGERGPQGDVGSQGEIGPQGERGPQGTCCNVTAFADFFALMPNDNAADVAVGTAVDFPQDGPSFGGIVRTGPNTFLLPNIGSYSIFFQASVTQAGQLILAFDAGAGFLEDPTTVAGRATGTSQIIQTCIITTTVINTLLQVRNPTGNSTALTITPLAGGTRPVSAHLVIVQLA